MGALDPRTPIDDMQRFPREFEEIKRRLDLLEAPSGTSAFRTVDKLAAAVAALPITSAKSATATGFGISNTYAQVASVQFTVPEGKTKAAVTVILNGAVLDMSTGGVTVAYGRANFGGALSQEFSASKDAGASVVNNVINGAYTYNANVTPGLTYAVDFEMRALNGSAFPASAGNYALVTIVVTFTDGTP